MAMSLLKGLAGAALNAALNSQGNGATAGGMQAVMGLAAQNPRLLQAAAGLLANGSAVGGLAGLVANFQRAGLGDAMNSWIGSGGNQAVTGSQIEQALGAETLRQVAGSAGLDTTQAAGLLAQVLPEVVNQLTPKGQMPAGGAGAQEAVMAMLGGLLRR
jgi:uncharacterized protein YidB (DUF937 family)